MNRKAILSLYLFGTLFIAGCGGGGGGTQSPPTITSVSASCNPTSLQAGQTAQTSHCTATVTGTGSYSSTVSWSASSGTITSAGVYTAPATVPTSGMATITATSTEDGTKSGQASITITPAPTITSVSASCNPASLQAHTSQTSQCTATVTGTGSYNSTVNWSATYGTITSAGVYTAPLTAPTSGMDTVTATSTADGTKSGQASITLTAARVIALAPLYPTVSLAEAGGGLFGVWIGATGIQTGDVISTIQMGVTASTTITDSMVTAGGFTDLINISEVPSFVQWACGSPTSVNAQCNTAWVAITTDHQQMAESKDSTTAYFNPGYTFGIQEFLLSSGANEGTLSLVGPDVTQNTAITVDSGSSGTGAVLSDVAFQAVNSTTGSATTGIIASNGTTLASIVARDGYGYLTQPNAGNVEPFTISTTSGLTVGTAVAAGNGPYAIDAATVNSADAIAVYSGQDTKARLFSNTLALESTSAALSNITPFLTVQSANTAATNGPAAQGGWPLRIIGSGTAAGTVGLLSSYDHVLDFLTISSGNVLSWPTSGYATLTGNPYLIAPDATHGAFIVASADTTNGVTTLERISTTSPYTATTITPSPALPAGFLASGILVSDDGTKIYVAGFNTTDTTKIPLFFTVVNP